MRFSVGYTPSPDSGFKNYIIENKEHIEEVYFSFGDFASGRNKTTDVLGLTSFEAVNICLESLKDFSQNGIKLNMLFNANCYGKDSLSRAFFEKVGDTVDYVKEHFGLDSVTTTSPVIAKFIKNNFADIKTRASVNMEIGSVEGFSYLEKYFDGFYLKRELNRNIPEIKRLKEYLNGKGKTLHLLANSGCLNYCSAHVFHDNLVGHEAEIVKMDNAFDFFGVCYEFLKDGENLKRYFSVTNFIRPEDLHLYEELFSSVKLATRTNINPVNVLKAYIERKYVGAVTDLLEPNHGKITEPMILENSLIPEDFGVRTSACKKDCKNCGYCAEVFDKCVCNLKDYIME